MRRGLSWVGASHTGGLGAQRYLVEPGSLGVRESEEAAVGSPAPGSVVPGLAGQLEKVQLDRPEVPGEG